MLWLGQGSRENVKGQVIGVVASGVVANIFLAIRHKTNIKKSLNFTNSGIYMKSKFITSPT